MLDAVHRPFGEGQTAASSVNERPMSAGSFASLSVREAEAFLSSSFYMHRGSVLKFVCHQGIFNSGYGVRFAPAAVDDG